MRQLKHEARAQVSLIQAKSKSDRSQTLVCIVQGSYAIYAEIFFMKLPTQLSRYNVHTSETAAVRLKEICARAETAKVKCDV